MRSKSWIFLPALFVATLAAAQQPAPAPAPPTFSERVEVRVLNLDVDVTDAEGNPVTDLKKEDFTVRIGKAAAPIDYFTRVDQGTIHTADLSTANPDQVLEAYRHGDETLVPRNFLIYVDLGTLSPGLRNRSLEALRDLVTKLGPRDAVRVVVFDRSEKVLTDWTTSKETAMAALSSIEKQGVGMSRLNAERLTISQIDSTRPRSRGSFVYQYAQEVGQEIETMLTGMRRELVNLTPLHGQRAFVFLSGGFEYQPGWVMAQYASGTNIAASNLTFTNIRDVPQRVGGLARDANSDSVTFYTIDANGLTGEGVSAAGDDPLASRTRVSFIARQDRQSGLVQLADETGGIALLNSNDFRGGLGRVYQAVSSYYSLGVTLSKLDMKGYEKISVEVNRPGVKVRSRKGYEPRSQDQIVGSRTLATLQTDLGYGAVPVAIRTAAATPGAKSLYTLPITVTMPASALTFVPDGDQATAKADLYIGSIDDKGRMSEISHQETSFKIPADKASTDQTLAYNATLQTKKGNYRVVVNVLDPASGKMGTAKANVRVE
jgi:VWFA-related protein